MTRNQICIILLLGVILTSCIKEKFDPAKFDASQKLVPGLAVPVGYSTLRVEKYLSDAIANNQLKVAPDGLLSLIYSDSVSSGTLDGLLSFPSISQITNLRNESGIDIYLPAGGPGLDFQDTVLIPVSLQQTSARLDSIRFLSGNIQTSLSISGLSGTITYDFQGLTLNKVSLPSTMPIPGPGLNLSLADYTIAPQQDADGNNFFKCIISIHVENTTDTIPAGSSILNIQTDVNNLMFETIYGDLSGFEIPLPPIQLEPGAFTQVVDGEFSFADPKINLFFSNSIGVPAGLFFSQLEAVMRDQSIVPLKAEDIPVPPEDPRIIAFPSPDKMGQLINDSLSVVKTNSNLPEFFSSNVNLINITPTPRIGPPEGTDTIVFIRYDSRIDLKASIEIPIWGKAEFFVLLDTITFDYLSTSLPLPEELEQLIVRLNLINSFPVTVAPQIYLLDENKIMLDSIITNEQTIEGAIDTNNDGKVDPHEQKIDLPLIRQETKDKLINTHYLVTKGKIKTSGFPAEDTKFFVDYFLYFNVGLIAQLKINTGK